MRERIEAVGTTLARQAVDIVALTSGRVAEIAFSAGRAGRGGRGAGAPRRRRRAGRGGRGARPTLREAELALERARKLRTNNTVAQATVDELEAAYLGASARLDGARKAARRPHRARRRSPAWSGCAGSTSAPGSTTTPC